MVSGPLRLNLFSRSYLTEFMLRQQPFSEQVGETIGYVTELVDRKIESMKVTAAEKSATAVSGIITGLILATFGLLFFVFFLVFLAVWIAGAKGLMLGFGIICGVLLLLMLLVFLLRNKMIADPAAKKTIAIFYGPAAEQQQAQATNE